MPKYGLSPVIGPAAEPLSVAEAQAHLNISDPALDVGYLQGLIVAARRRCEVQTYSQVVASTWLLSLDGFYYQNLLPRPGVMLSSLAGGLAGWADAWRVWQERGGGWGTADISTIRPPGGKLQAVPSITYIDDSGNLQTLSPSLYQVDTQQIPGRIVPSFGNVWPTTRSQLNAVQITYQAGYPHTKASASITAGSGQVVTPASMAGIYQGSVLWVQGAENSLEWIAVTSVTGTTFTATFAQNHTGPVTISAVPAAARHGMLLLIGQWYERRDPLDSIGGGTELPFTVSDLWSTLWTGEM